MLMSSSGFQVFAAASAAGFTRSPPYSLTGNSTAPASRRTMNFSGDVHGKLRDLLGLATVCRKVAKMIVERRAAEEARRLANG